MSIEERRFIILRKRLDQKGYRQTLGIESVPLVEKLFSDLIRTTNSQNFDALLEPYKADKARVEGENEKLRLELFKLGITQELERDEENLHHQTPSTSAYPDQQLLSEGSQLQGALKSQEREINSLKRQLDISQEEHAKFKREKDVALRENRRLQDDLATMTREHQAVHGQIIALHEKDELKMRVEAYNSFVSRFEILMKIREQENRDLLGMTHSIHSSRPQTLNEEAHGTLSTRGREKSSSDQALQETATHGLPLSSPQSASSSSGSSNSLYFLADNSILQTLDRSTEE